MKSPKHRMTKQRRLILKTLRSTNTHPTADWIYERVKKDIPNISLGTVYRNLKLLADMGEIMVLDFGSSYSRFDGNPENHYHFTCEKCGGVFDLDMPLNNELNQKVNEETPYKVYSHRIEFYGLCLNCQQKN
ncbi:transcriptional repressor [Halocella sp. SP3-1]|uniref:Fur family transcriptional regulator n=1 Tax=Halocella sp. SP3-1 TaxID=2382161 RepID=UPI000F74FB52|nr:transcriptional repressor [Halocella sp. SP3-1]AZO95079.1 transcriptional repressor [Halocella sp. SP3-1]